MFRLRGPASHGASAAGFKNVRVIRQPHAEFLVNVRREAQQQQPAVLSDVARLGMAPTRSPLSAIASCTIRTARSRISGGYRRKGLFGFATGSILPKKWSLHQSQGSSSYIFFARDSVSFVNGQFTNSVGDRQFDLHRKFGFK